MAPIARSIDIPVESEIATRLREADDAPVVFVVGGARYRVVREESSVAEDDTWAGYNPEKAIEGMRAAAGAITEEEAERWIADVYRWRREGSRPEETSL